MENQVPETLNEAKQEAVNRFLKDMEDRTGEISEAAVRFGVEALLDEGETAQ